jgi:hypothetical protein
MDLICSNCGEPWEVGHVLHEQPELFERKGSVITSCPCCDANITFQENELSDQERNKIKQWLSDVKDVCEMLGDDIDGAASYLKDFNLI